METTQERNRKAVVIGATGLVGRHLVDQLLEDERYGRVTAFTRRKMDVEHEKLQNLVIDFEDINQYADTCTGHDFFSCLGTTRRKAGNKTNQYRVDYLYQLEFARMAAKNRMDNYVLVSAAGANANSSLFYNRIKGSLEKEVQKLFFKNTTILRPSVLTGKRGEFRLAEQMGILALKTFSFIKSIKPYKPIHGSIVARAMIEVANSGQEDLFIYELDDLFKLAA